MELSITLLHEGMQGQKSLIVTHMEICKQSGALTFELTGARFLRVRVQRFVYAQHGHELMG